jgi:hypothetical protein
MFEGMKVHLALILIYQFQSCRKNSNHFNLVHLTTLSNTKKSLEDRISQVTAFLVDLFAGVPKYTMVIILTGANSHARLIE